jgi:hypothetical protein
MREAPELSISRVQNYMPDNVLARLSYDASNLQVTVEDREKAMKAILDNLARFVEGKRE